MYQNQQWKNPYSAKRKRTPALQRSPKSADLVPQQKSQLIPPKQETKNMKHSLLRVKEQVSGVREQLEQMETTINTLFNVMDAIERFGAGGKKGKGDAGLLKTFQNIDFKQVMNLLQSPLVQALVETMGEEETETRKKK